MKKTTLWIVALLAVATLAGCNKAPVENPEEAGAFDPDQEYTNYNWILWREEGGEWIVVDRWY